MWIRGRVVWRLPLARTRTRRGGHARQKLAQFPDLFCQVSVHSRDPVVRASDWPWAKNRFLLVFCRMSPSAKAVTSPLLGPFDHCRSYGVPFHVTQNRIEMIIFLGWNCFVRPLMQVAGSDGMMMQIPATPMRCGQLLHETPQVTILQRPQDQMPVIRHEAIALKNPKKTLEKQKLCFYDFLRDVFVARFSGERRQGARCLLGISRSQISGCKSSGSGTRAAGWPPNHSVFSK